MAPLIQIAYRISGATLTVVLSEDRLNDAQRSFRTYGRSIELTDAVDLLKTHGIDVRDRKGRDRTKVFDLFDLKDKHKRRIINVVLIRDTSTNQCRLKNVDYVEEKPIEIQAPAPPKQMKLF